MTDMNPDIEKDQTSDEVTVETTSVFRADFLSELDAPAQAGTESAVSGVEGAPAGLGVAGSQTRPQRRVPVPTRPSHHVGWSASRQRHISRRRDREPSPC